MIHCIPPLNEVRGNNNKLFSTMGISPFHLVYCILFTWYMASVSLGIWHPFHLVYGILFTWYMASFSLGIWHPFHLVYGILFTWYMVSFSLGIWHMHLPLQLECFYTSRNNWKWYALITCALFRRPSFTHTLNGFQAKLNILLTYLTLVFDTPWADA